MDVSVSFTDSLTVYANGLIPALSGVVAKATFDVEAHAKTAIKTGAKTGRVYKRRRKGKRGGFIRHQASAEGEAPASDTGALANSIRGKLDTPGGLSGTVSVGAGYGAILEEDLNRPFMAPAAEAVQPSLVAGVAAVLEGKGR